jgi:hypothetical protein
MVENALASHNSDYRSYSHMYADNELLIPPHVVNHLQNARGAEWGSLVDRVSRLPEDHTERLAFSLMMIRLDGCLNCETDSYRAMKGCVACAKQTLRRYKGSDRELRVEYEKALVDVESFLAVSIVPPSIEEPVSARAA